MFGSARRPVASLCIALLVFNMIACKTVKRQEAETILRQGGQGPTTEKIVGATLKDGREFRFDDMPRPFVRADTLRAAVAKQPREIPVADLQRVWVQSVSKGRTTLAGIGVAFGVLGAAVAANIAGIR